MAALLEGPVKRLVWQLAARRTNAGSDYAQYRKIPGRYTDNRSGKVFVTLQPYRFTITGIESEHDLMSSRFGSYGEMNKGWSGDDVKGFAKIFGNQTAIFHKINEAAGSTK